MSAAGDSRTAAADAMNDAMPGQHLGEARVAQNLTAADVARRLKLSVWQVEALESGRYDRLPGPVFVRGFIRNYARLLKLDPDGLLHAAAGNLPQAVPAPDGPLFRDIPMPSSTTGRWQKYAFGSAVVIALLAVYEFYWNEPEREAPLPVAAAPDPPAPAPPQKIASAQSPATAVAIPAAPAAREPSSAASGAQIAGKPDAAKPAAARQESGKPAAPGERELRFVFDEESWVEIRDSSDRTIFSQLNLAGTSRRVTGVPPLSIVVGNAQGVKLTYSGKSIDLARHTKTEVARLTLE